MTQREFQDQQMLINIIFSEFNQPGVNFDLYDGILSGGYVSKCHENSFSKVLKAIKLSQKGPLVKYGGETA